MDTCDPTLFLVIFGENPANLQNNKETMIRVCDTKTSTKKLCDTIAASIARYEILKYRCWASKSPGKQPIKKRGIKRLSSEPRQGQSSELNFSLSGPISHDIAVL